MLSCSSQRRNEGCPPSFGKSTRHMSPAKQSATSRTPGAIRQQPLIPRALSGNWQINFGLMGNPGFHSRKFKL